MMGVPLSRAFSLRIALTARRTYPGLPASRPPALACTSGRPTRLGAVLCRHSTASAMASALASAEVKCNLGRSGAGVVVQSNL